jgi:tRNA(Leu) C34 or U34 (ribose-2'-O)-methylase TrmL
MNAPGVVLINPKYAHNVAAAIRACSCFGISSLVWTGGRVDPKQYDRLPREERMKGYKDVEWVQSAYPFDFYPKCVVPVCVEIGNGAMNLVDFSHPPQAVYVFGPEDGGVPQVIRRFCHHFIYIPSYHCLNLSAALNVVLYDRVRRFPEWHVSPKTTENRGEIPVPGWEGK